MSRLRAIIGILAVFLLALPAQAVASGQSMQIGGREVTYWVPSASGKQPLILFSHGFKGCSTQSAFLTEALAEHGYWVFAPNHKDAACGATGRIIGRPEESFLRVDKWSDETYTDRADDIRDILYALQVDPEFKDRIDFTRVALMGHSLGGYTALGLAGAWASWKLPGIKAVLALSPYIAPFNEQHTLKDLQIPVMYQGGTRDTGITPWIQKQGGSYDQTPMPKYFIEFDRANHFAWTGLIHQYRASIVAYSEAFLDHYVKDEPATPALTTMRGDVEEMRYVSDLGSFDSNTNGN